MGLCPVKLYVHYNGHDIFMDRCLSDPTHDVEPQFDQIRAVPFVRHLRLIPAKSGDRNSSGVLEITTPRGKHRLPLIVKRSYLDRSTVNAVIGQIQGERKAAKGGSQSSQERRNTPAGSIPGRADCQELH